MLMEHITILIMSQSQLALDFTPKLLGVLIM